MKMIKPLASMELDDESKMDAPMPIAMPTKPDFPYGLRICLTDEELRKLDLDPAEADCGDVFTFTATARVSHKTESEGPDGKCCRIEAQIEEMRVEETGEPGA